MKNENELTALALTIEKCQEIVGCPAGVDLQDRIKQLRGEGGMSYTQELRIGDKLYRHTQQAPVITFYRDGIEVAAEWIDQ